MSNFRNALNRRTILVVIIWFNVAASAACTMRSESGHSEKGVSPTVVDTLLNSERIRLKYGSYGVEVLYSDSTTRITSLYNEDGDVRITRTYAIVLYPAVIDSALAYEHNSIIGGGSIGQVFKERGWKIEKRSMYLGQLSSSAQFGDVYVMMGGIDSTELAIYLYSFTVEKDGRSYEYATIAEVYHPDYLTADDLSRIYEAVDDSSTSASEVEQKLGVVRSFMSLDMMLVEPFGQ